MFSNQQDNENKRLSWFATIERSVAFIASVGGAIFGISWFLGRRYVEGVAKAWGLPLNQIQPSSWDYVEVGALHLGSGILLILLFLVYLVLFMICLIIIHYGHQFLRSWLRGVLLMLAGASLLIPIITQLLGPVALLDGRILFILGVTLCLSGFIITFRPWLRYVVSMLQSARTTRVRVWSSKIANIFFQQPQSIQHISFILQNQQIIKKALPIAWEIILILLLLTQLLLVLSLQTIQDGTEQGRADITANAKKVRVITNEQVMNVSPTIISTTISNEASTMFVYDNIYWLGNNSNTYWFFEDIQAAPSCKPTRVYVLKKENVQSVEIMESPLDKGCIPTPTPSLLSTSTPTPVNMPTPSVTPTPTP